MNSEFTKNPYLSTKDMTFSSININRTTPNNFETPTSSFESCKNGNYMNKFPLKLDQINEYNNIEPDHSSSISLTIFNENIQYRMLTNYVKLLLFFNFIPLIGFTFSFIYYRWYIVQFDNDKFWINLLFVYDEQANKYYTIEYFQEDVCWDYLQRNLSMSCDFFQIFKVTGSVAFFFMIIAASMHIFHILQLVVILLKKYQFLQWWFCIKLKTLQVSVFTLYLGGIFIWVFFILLSQRTVSNYGLSFYIAIVSTLFYCAVFFYFVRLKKILKERKMISNLLNPDALLRKESKSPLSI